MASRTDIVRPPEPPGPLTWVKKNLFNTWYDAILTIVSLIIVVGGLYLSVRWIFFSADWAPVINNPILYAVGQYPRDQLWRIGAMLAMISFLIGVSWRVWGGILRTFSFIYGVFLLVGVFWPAQGTGITPGIRLFLVANVGLVYLGFLAGRIRIFSARITIFLWLASIMVSLVLLSGVSALPFLPVVPTGVWGGILVTMILAIGGIVLSFPLGVLLALGRRSSLPVVRLFSTTFIEVVRGVPLIGILFLSSIILPLFLPPQIRIDRLLRALIGMMLFSAAYMAENVRGGLAAVPFGQEEAARALGLNNFQITLRIVLPQALRAVIPPIVGQFISLFKDTTLASGVAVLELLAVGRSILQANPEYISLQAEVYLFVAAVFWIFSYLMSYASQRLEVALGVGER